MKMPSIIISILVFAFANIAIESLAQTGKEMDAHSLAVVYVSETGDYSREDGSAQFPFHSIPAALEFAAPGADIYVSGGTYVDPIDIDFPVHLHGDSNNVPQITGDYSIDHLVSFRQAGSIENFKISSDRSMEELGLPIGIRVYARADGEISIHNCAIEGTITGIEIQGSGIVRITNNVLVDNVIAVGVIGNKSLVLCDENEIKSNGTGIFSTESNLELSRNRISGNDRGVQLASRVADGNSFQVGLFNNEITANKLVGVWIDHWVAPASGSDTVIAGNTIGYNGTDDLGIESRAVLVIQGNTWLTEKINDLLASQQTHWQAN